MSTVIDLSRWFFGAIAFTIALGVVEAPRARAKEFEFITLAPGHFHAALVQKQALPNVSSRVRVYAPLGFDLTAHLERVASFNNRADNPTRWQLEVQATDDYLARFRKEKPGNVVIISGRNAGKIDLIEAAIDAGMNVLVDKPWIIDSKDHTKLVRVLDKANKAGLVAYDIMTERFEATNALQRALVNAPEVYGQQVPGSENDPGVYIENVHHFMKTVAGRPNVRPAWFFDSRQQGEGMADTGTHLVDLVQWTLAPDQALRVKDDVAVVSAVRWPTKVTLGQFQSVTGRTDSFPDELAGDMQKDVVSVFANTQATFKLRGTFVKMASMWQWQAKPGAGDWHYAVYRGSRASIELRQGAAQKYVPELYVVPNGAGARAEVEGALRAKVAQLATAFPGISVVREKNALRVLVPAELRTGHEAHFSEVTRSFLSYLENRKAMPAWEQPNMLTKYWITTQATDLSRTTPALTSFRSRAPR